MRHLREAWARLRSFLRTQARDRDFEEELDAHIDMAVQDYLRQGIAEPEARRLALVKLGGLEQARQRHRESRGLPWLDGIVQDVRYACRNLRRSPGFTLTVVITLAIGIGINAAVFTVTDAIVFRGFRFVDNDRIVYLRSQSTRQPREFAYSVSYRELEDWRARATSFSGMAAYADRAVSLSDGAGAAERLYGTSISTNAFALVGQQPVLGRDFVASDAGSGATPVVILSHRVWHSRYGDDPAIVGRTLRLNGVPTLVVGVMPEGFIFPGSSALWMPLTPPVDEPARDARDLFMAVARLADGTSIETARAEMDAIGRHVTTSASSTAGDTFVALVRDFSESHTAPTQAQMYQSMWGAVGCLLLIACANLANLLLARSIGQSREIGIRMALGAGRWRIVRQLLVENAMLSAVGGLFAWWIAAWSLRVYVPLAYPGYSWYDFSMNGRVIGYLIAVAAVTGLLFGLAPALRLLGFDLNATLKDGGRGATTGRRGKRLAGLLVIAEMALTVMLLAAAGVMVRTLLNAYVTDVGADSAHLLTVSGSLPAPRYPTNEARMAFYDRLENRLRALPGVASITLANQLPMSYPPVLPYERTGGAPIDAEHRPTVSVMAVDSNYVETLGASIRDGQPFAAADDAANASVVLVNEQFAREQWPGASPIGASLRLFTGPGAGEWLQVVGVVSNIVQTPLDPHGDNRDRGPFEPLVYLPYRRAAATLGGTRWAFMARTQVAPKNLIQAFRREIQALDPDLPADITPLAEYVAIRQWEFGIDRLLFLTFAAIALLLASAGLYAVVAHAVSRRTQEVGVRMAMGALPGDILRLVVRQGMWPVGLGLAIGLAGAFAATPLLRTALVQVSAADPVTYLIVSTVLIASGLLGCWLPARRAMRIDPVVALRHD